tara:strand:- start:449 stop:583 length:135 start_codon:yes stop_codon:yes gene_type:complete
MFMAERAMTVTAEAVAIALMPEETGPGLTSLVYTSQTGLPMIIY